jgi:hypothetical protein
MWFFFLQHFRTGWHHSLSCYMDRNTRGFHFLWAWKLNTYFSPIKNFWTHNSARRSQWPRGLRRRSAAARLLRLWVRSHQGHGCLSVVNAVCYQVEVSVTSWSLVQGSPTDCGASLCVIQKPREWGGPGPLGGCCATKKSPVVGISAQRNEPSDSVKRWCKIWGWVKHRQKDNTEMRLKLG